MKNKQVKYVWLVDGLANSYLLEDSKRGLVKPRNHPLHSNSKVLTELLSVRVGDILRCDGLPFMSRPRPIYTLKRVPMDVYGLPIKKVIGARIGDEVSLYSSFNKVKTYEPVKVHESYWVLRKVIN